MSLPVCHASTATPYVPRERPRNVLPSLTATLASASICVLTSTDDAAPPGDAKPAFMVKPSALSEEIAHTGFLAVRIDFDSAVSIEIACSGFVSEPLRSIQRPSQPVDTTPPGAPLNHRSELSKWLTVNFVASTAGMIARSEPAPPLPSPYSVSSPRSATPLSPPPPVDTITFANASGAPPASGVEPTRSTVLGPWPRWIAGRAATYDA